MFLFFIFTALQDVISSDISDALKMYQSNESIIAVLLKNMLMETVARHKATASSVFTFNLSLPSMNPIKKMNSNNRIFYHLSTSGVGAMIQCFFHLHTIR